jgi:hypothetical protein
VTASELGFLGLGLLLGAASGAALVVLSGSRSQRREIRVTVTRDALPRRSETLSQDAFLAGRSGPAPGGPGDRRWVERDMMRPVRAGASPDLGGVASGSMVESDEPPLQPRIAPPDRTAVPSPAAAVAIAVEPEVDRELAELLRSPGPPAALERMLRGEHLAMVEVVDRIAGEDPWRRREWELLLGGLVEAMTEVAVRESVIDFPMGTAFWDALTVEQCRRVVAALSSMGYEYDGRSGWVGSRVPAYRELTIALADIGVDPKRLRAWPNQAEIAQLFVGARPAPEELLPAAGPDYAAADVRALVGERGPELGNLWLAWDAVRPLLFDASTTARERVEV